MSIPVVDIIKIVPEIGRILHQVLWEKFKIKVTDRLNKESKSVWTKGTGKIGKLDPDPNQVEDRVTDTRWDPG